MKLVKPCLGARAYVYYLFDTIFSRILLESSGDIETNPGPRKCSPNKFCVCHLNRLIADEFIKAPFIEVL